MKKTYKEKIINVLILTLLMNFILCSVDVFAENYETGGDTFYMPKEYFQSTFEYKEYCKRMYKDGYMDESYNWIPEVENYLNNPTEERNEIAYEARKSVIQKRIDEGKMLPEESPFLTYDERQSLIKQREEGKLPDPPKPKYTDEELHDFLVKQNQNGGSENIENVTDDESEEINQKNEDDENTIIQIEKQQKEQEEEKEREAMKEEGGVWGIVSKAIIAVGAVILILIGYYIYKRQFV